MATLVKFYIENENQVLAFFSQLNWNKELYGNNTKTCYAHVGQHSACKKEYVKDLKTVMEESDFTNLDEITRKDFEGTKENFYKKIAYCSVGSYLNSKSLVLMNSNLEYIYLNEDEYKDTILNNPRVYANNAFSPRISYKEEIRDEDEVEKPKKSKVTQEIQNLINKLGKNNFELTKYGLGVKSTIDNTIKNKLINKDFIQKADIALSDGKKYHLLTDKKIKIDDLF
jgi:hypothetical protein